MNRPHFAPWPAMRVGDLVLIRDRRTARELTVIVAGTLPSLEGEGPGIRDSRGRTIRHHFYEARPLTADPLAADQDRVNELFAQITAPTPARGTDDHPHPG